MRIRAALAALAVGAAACGGGGAETTAAQAERPTTAVASSSTAAPTTTSPPSTTTTEPSTTTTSTTVPDPRAVLLADLAGYGGSFSGEWVNTTYGSRGPIEASLSIDVESMTATLSVDLGGFVFGSSDPAPETITVSLADLQLTTDGAILTGPTSETFGPLVVSLTADGFEVVGTEVPNSRIASIRVHGPLAPDEAEMEYEVEFAGGGGAVGTVTVRRTGADPGPGTSGDGEAGQGDGVEADVAAFLDDLAVAFRDGDGEHLLAALHPAVIDWYGEQQCTDYTGSLLIPDIAFEVLEVTGPADWTYDQDGAAIPVEEVLTAVVRRPDLGQEVEIHLALLDGVLRWFTDCGDPV